MNDMVKQMCGLNFIDWDWEFINDSLTKKLICTILILEYESKGNWLGKLEWQKRESQWTSLAQTVSKSFQAINAIRAILRVRIFGWLALVKSETLGPWN